MTVASSPSAPLGVTVAICTYNGAERLPTTLAHLRTQSVPAEISWEVLLIDNASTDNSADVARAHWSSRAPVPLRVVREGRLGLSYARERAFAEAAYPVVLFVDDDNWLSPIWVETVSDIMTTRPKVGACGGGLRPVFETTPRPWVTELNLHVEWPALNESQDITDTVGWLPGAGLSIRMSAYRELCDAGFRQIAVGRQGSKLTVAEDVELCFALRMAGWRLWLESPLTMEHFIPARRLTWDYARAAMHGFGFSEVALDEYRLLLTGGRKRHSKVVRTWLWQLMVVVKCIAQNLALRPRKVIGRSLPQYEGDPEVLRIFGYLGRLDGLLNSRRNYKVNSQAVKRLAKHLNKRAENSALPLSHQPKLVALASAANDAD